MSTASTADATATIVERFSLKALVEACLVVEEGVATTKDTELGMMAGAGILPGPFARADEQGLDEVLAALERAEAEWGERFAPPLLLQAARRSGSARQEVRPGVLPLPAARRRPGRASTSCSRPAGTSGSRGSAARPPTRSRREVIRELTALWGEVEGKLRALVFASSNIFTFSAGADIKAFTKMDPETEGRELVESGACVHARDGELAHGHDRGGQLARLRRRL